MAATVDSLDAEYDAIARGDHADPFAVLGMHTTGDAIAVRTFQPDAAGVDVVDSGDGKIVMALDRVHPAGLFAGEADGRNNFAYRLQLDIGGEQRRIEDPYRFPPVMDTSETVQIAEGTHPAVWRCLGAHPTELEGVAGVVFAVWAPNARRVSVVGDFNQWDGRRHVMRKRHEAGIWELFIPDVALDALYKYEIKAPNGELLPLKADPVAFHCQASPATSSRVHGILERSWNDATWMADRHRRQAREAPVSIYECHLGSWMRTVEGRYLSYAELAERLIPYVRAMGFTHLELLPVSEHPFDGSWGYQPVGLYAPTSRFGPPATFAGFVDACHQAGIGVILDWVPAHFPRDPHGLAGFDGTPLYEHGDPRRGYHPDWDTLIYDFGRPPVRNFLVSNALYWLETFHIDGLRVDAVASMLYLDYSRGPGQWAPNIHGGNENLEAIAFLQRMNEAVYGRYPDAATLAEESTAWPGVTQPTFADGLGFGYKWNMGWMHDTLSYMRCPPAERCHRHGQLVFSMEYAFSENYLLPLSHDEVVHGKGSLIRKMPGDDKQRFANLRAYYGYMFAHPGKKLLFMGGEFAQEAEWNHDRGLHWDLLDDPRHKGVQTLVGDLNAIYRRLPALHELDCVPEGFEWIESHDWRNAVIAFLRRGHDPDHIVVAVCNFTQVPQHAYRVGVPEAGFYKELLNTDAERYGGSNMGNLGGVMAERVPAHGRPHSLALTLPPLATLLLERQP
ncbi:1,4-alpha-glucan branching protein GlgB [Ferruginivarius sediminum]|uniref:1,4-alpha-glucan branching enzyme GlgB n=1 Tax=Ferruginivarius sediminum TaxID=2661937 RepID=A0A369TEL7_9PROT|nr:1,4-alpha-glucan branching protein GlgB [Ferruginivarius sediminum]RDD63801.1 1,4-alpha-glucan branching protein GlgB [Ferruginivarius sediminum]